MGEHLRCVTDHDKPLEEDYDTTIVVSLGEDYLSQLHFGMISQAGSLLRSHIYFVQLSQRESSSNE